jgi:hypothetical protein
MLKQKMNRKMNSAIFTDHNIAEILIHDNKDYKKENRTANIGLA